MPARPAAAIALAALLAACASQQPTRTGFLGAAEPAAAPAPARDYRAFLIEEVVFRPAAGAVQNPGEADIAPLLEAYRSALDTAFAARFARAEAPGPGVLRVRAAVTGYARANVALNVIATPLVGPVSNGGASTEAEVLDSVTGRRVAALAEARNEHLFTAGPFAYYRGLAMAEGALARMAQDLAARVPAPATRQVAGR
jgi:hypothetical protein